jgi:hypothetical protein
VKRRLADRRPVAAAPRAPRLARLRHVALPCSLLFVSLPASGSSLLASHSSAQTDDARGPAEIHDEHVLAQSRLTLPAITPVPTPAGRWSFEVSTLWSSSFAWVQEAPGEAPKRRTFLIDAETHTLDLRLCRGLSRDLDVSARLPLRWRGGGVMDGLIDWWHGALGLPNSGRPDFRRNAFRVEGARSDGGAFSWNDERGTGLGDLELATRWRFATVGERGSALALVGRASLPTGSGPFAGNGIAAGSQLVGRAPLGGRVDLYAGIGGSAQPHGPVRGIEYRPLRVHGFVALEWRPWRRLSLVAETNAASGLVANVASYPGPDWLLDVSGRVRLGRRTLLDLGFTEGLIDQLSTTDFALFAGIAVRP